MSVGANTTMKLKGLVKDFARFHSIDFSEANLITSIIDMKDNTMLDLFKRSAIEPRLKAFIKNNSDIFYTISQLIDQPKTLSIHPCAMIIFPSTMTAGEWCPIRTQGGLIVSEWGGTEMDEAGFLKEDILGIKQLDKFDAILKLIAANGKEVPDIFNLPHDSEVFRYFGNGWNGDVFQMGSAGLTEYSKTLKPSNVEDLIAAVSLYRPGPMENHYHEIYAKCKNQGRLVQYLWGTEEITKDTYGLYCYQEQIMRVCQEIGGLSMKEADDVRRAMGKKNLKYLKVWEERIKKGYLEKGATEAQFQESWEVMQEFAKYSFNKCISGDEKIYKVGEYSEKKNVREMFNIKHSNPNDLMGHDLYLHGRYNTLGYGYSSSLNETGILVTNKIKDIRYEGVREIYRMKLINGKTICTTSNHKFPTSNGEKKLEDIDIYEDKIYCKCLTNAGVELISIESIRFIKTDDVYDVEMESPYHTFTLDSGIVTCNSHATAYALTSYVCQYLKVHFPIEYWTVSLHFANEDGVLNYLSEIMQAKTITIKPPDINKSKATMESDQESSSIFWGIESIKGIGEDTATQIIEERDKNGKYKSFADFYFRHCFTGSKVKKQTYEALISAGAFDILYGFSGCEQRRMNLISRYRKYKKVKITSKTDVYTYGNISERYWWLLNQKHLTGLAFIDYKDLAEKEGIETTFCTALESTVPQESGLVRAFGGYVVEVRISRSKRGDFARLTIEHNYKLFKMIIWAEEFGRYRDMIKNSEKKIIVFDAELKFEAKYSKSNQFTINKHSQIKVL